MATPVLMLSAYRHGSTHVAERQGCVRNRCHNWCYSVHRTRMPARDSSPQGSHRNDSRRRVVVIRMEEHARTIIIRALRHTFGTHSSNAAVPLWMACSALRHSGPSLTARVHTTNACTHSRPPSLSAPVHSDQEKRARRIELPTLSVGMREPSIENPAFDAVLRFANGRLHWRLHTAFPWSWRRAASSRLRFGIGPSCGVRSHWWPRWRKRRSRWLR